MEENALVVFHGFLNLTAKEKLQLVGAVNEFFDELNRREAIRAAAEADFQKLDLNARGKICKCCGR